MALAESLGATIDTTASLCHAPSLMAQQQVGKVTGTLGEVRNRADLVVFWGSDPVSTHPRHWERYSVHAAGRSVPDGRRSRFVVVADTARTASADAADLFVPIEPGRHFEALFALRAMVQGSLSEATVCDDAPVPLLAELARRMKSSRCGVIFFGVGLARGESGHCNVQALLQLVTDLNGPGRWYAMRMRVQGNVVGADSVLLWQTGYPFAVNMARGYPRYNPGEFSVQGLLERVRLMRVCWSGAKRWTGYHRRRSVASGRFRQWFLTRRELSQRSPRPFASGPRFQASTWRGPRIEWTASLCRYAPSCRPVIRAIRKCLSDIQTLGERGAEATLRPGRRG